MWRLEDGLLELVFAFFHVNSRDQTQASGLGIKCPQTLSHLVGPIQRFTNE